MGYTGFQLGFTGFDWVFFGSSEFHQVSLRFYWVLHDITRFYWVLLGFTGFY